MKRTPNRATRTSHPSRTGPLTNVEGLPKEHPERGEDLEEERKEGQDEEDFQPCGTSATL